MKSALESAISSSWTEGGSFNQTGNFTDNYDYESAVYVVGNTNLSIDYDVDVSAQSSDSKKWEYSGTATFSINDAFVDAVDLGNWWDGDQDLWGGTPFDMNGSWDVNISGLEM